MRSFGWLGGLTLAAAAVLVAVPAQAGTSPWTIQRTPHLVGLPSDLSGVACYSADTCLAVGTVDRQGLIEWGRDGTWKRYNTSLPTMPLAAVSCTSTPSCLVVGSLFAVGGVYEEWAMQWSGGRWTAYEPPSDPAKSSVLTAVSCASATDCMVVGQAASTTGDQVSAVTQQWNGSHWTILTPPRTAQTHLTGISCPTTTDCTAVGWYRHSGQQQPIAARWNGKRWAVALPPAPSSATVAGLTAVSCVSARYCVAVGHDTVGGRTSPLVESWNGQAWTEQTAGPARGTLTGVSCPAIANCTAVGTAGNAAASALAEVWNGSIWTVQPTATPARYKTLSGVSCLTATTCTAVGDHTVDSGDTLAEHE
jgi:hypothetical protein